ncbi:Peptidase S41 family protein ustP [Hypsizygus marmoreus]|uniref:Peptidase S41 family protein ustP n=1 Tax=Hypsizygus marmoreus TaxID=39966 RepID=A0A369JV52_HYPMA|nr:Peptidase S41 family protein ustP [Hypsizygus marmoreus]
MLSTSRGRAIWILLVGLASSVSGKTLPVDPCASIAGKKWVFPRHARACMSATPVDPNIKANLIEVVNKTLAFHTSVNYQIQAPEPYQHDVHEDLKADLARISRQDYASEFELHLDMYRSFKRVNDGHCGVYNYCYDSFYLTYIPAPLVLLTEVDGSQNVYIAPEAFKVASAEFGDEIKFWQNALPGDLKGKLSSLSGARVLLINDQDPFVAINQNALITGGYQAFSTRQNSFFSSYYRGPEHWLYSMGNFAQQVHPLIDSVRMTIQRVNSTSNDTIDLPYRSRFGSASKNFTDLASYRDNNCRATNKTNGLNLYGDVSVKQLEDLTGSVSYYQQQPAVSSEDKRRHAMNVMLDGMPITDIELPTELQPVMSPLNESYSIAQFYMLDDKITGVLALGSFSAKNFTALGQSLLSGLQELTAKGATQLVVDVTNNGGGYICIAHWLHRIIIGPSDTTEPQAGLDTTTRAGPLAQLIVKRIAEGGDPQELLYYNPIQWTNASHLPFPASVDWLQPVVKKTINGHEDAFSQRLGQECQPFSWTPPKKALFDPAKVVIVSNGRCGSSCSLFSITMAKHEGVKTVVVGGKNDVPQQYCGTVGGQSTDFSSIDTEIKSTGFKDHELAPPDFLTNSVQGITWRLGFGINDKNEPEEWQDHPADINFSLTFDNVNNPVAIWTDIAERVFANPVTFRVQC